MDLFLRNCEGRREKETGGERIIMHVCEDTCVLVTRGCLYCEDVVMLSG